MREYNFCNGKGMLKSDYNFRATLKFEGLNRKLFCSRKIKLDNATVERVIKSKKYMIKGLVQGTESVENLSQTVADGVGLSLANHNFMENGNFALFAMKNKVDGKEIVEMCMVKVIRGTNLVSVSLYYVPNGVMYNACMVARYCWHKTNEHQNRLNSTKAEKGQFHLHKYSEEFYNNVMSDTTISDDTKVKKLQSPDAIILNEGTYVKPEEIIKTALKGFNIENVQELEAYGRAKQNKKYYSDENGKFHKGKAEHTLTKAMSEEMSL